MRAKILLLVLLVPYAFAHGDASVWEQLGIYDPLSVLLILGSISLAFLLHAILFRKNMPATTQKISFLAIAVPIVIATVYLSASTVYLNFASASNGPVHWHADFEVWACGEKYELADPHALDNKVGEATVHEHNDNRIHIEGVLLNLEEASVGEFFEAVGGKFTREYLEMPTEHEIKSWGNGDLCSGLPGKWLMFVNGELNEEMEEHIIAPYGTVPPGDEIKIVFTDKTPDQVNPNLSEVP